MSLTGTERIVDLALEANGLMVQCLCCPRATGMPFRLMVREHRLAATADLGSVVLRLRCQGCRARVSALSQVTLWRNTDGQPKR